MTIKEIKEAYRPDQTAQDAIWVHSCNIEGMEKVEEMINTNNSAEICVTKKGERYGIMGVLVKGQVTLMANGDIGSKYDPVSKERSFEVIGNWEKVIVKHYNDLTPKADTSYTESFLIPKEIVGVWVWKEAYDNREDVQWDFEEFEQKGYPVFFI